MVEGIVRVQAAAATGSSHLTTRQICMLPITPGEFANVMSEVGFAIWQIQILEQGLAYHLVLVHKASAKTARADVEAMFVKTEKQTLGRLLKTLRDDSLLASKILSRLESLVEERNWLVHRSRHENRTDLYSRAKRLALIRRIHAIADEALAISETLQQTTEDHLVAQGMPKSEMETRAAKIYRDWLKAS